jgi:methionine-rich copper-binding protein CopC
MKHKLWALAMALLVAFPLPAKAHDQLVDQSPGEGETVSAGVVELRLSFNNELLEIESGNEVVVSSPSGALVYAGCLPTFGRDGAVELDLDEAGTYEVSWRVVSQDGHPISDTFEFSLVNDSGYVSDPEFAYPDCAGEVQIQNEEQPEIGYWFLWLSLGLVAAGVFFFLRPKNRP